MENFNANNAGAGTIDFNSINPLCGSVGFACLNQDYLSRDKFKALTIRGTTTSDPRYVCIDNTVQIFDVDVEAPGLIITCDKIQNGGTFSGTFNTLWIAGDIQEPITFDNATIENVIFDDSQDPVTLINSQIERVLVGHDTQDDWVLDATSRIGEFLVGHDAQDDQNDRTGIGCFAEGEPPCIPEAYFCASGAFCVNQTIRLDAGGSLDTEGLAASSTLDYSAVVAARPPGSIAAPVFAGPDVWDWSFTPDLPGTYVIELCVTANDPAFTCPHEDCTSVTLTISDCPPIVESEPNDSCPGANTVALGLTALGSINPIGDRDYYFITLPTNLLLTAETTAPTAWDTVVQFENLTGVPIGCDDDSGTGLLSLLSCCVPAGSYCVQVAEASDIATIPLYVITFTDGGPCVPGPPCPLIGGACPF